MKFRFATYYYSVYLVITRANDLYFVHENISAVATVRSVCGSFILYEPNYAQEK